MGRAAVASGGLTAILRHPEVDGALEMFDAPRRRHRARRGRLHRRHRSRIFSACSAGILRINGRSLPSKVSVLNGAQEGDIVKNTSAAAADGWYVGPVVKDTEAGSFTWDPLRGFADVGTATLSAGMVTVANTKITVNTRIRVYHSAAHANAGALWAVKTRRVRVHDQVHPVADDSVVMWVIVSYG